MIISREYIRSNYEEFLVTHFEEILIAHSGELLLSHSKEFIATNSGEFILPIPGNLSIPLLEKMWTNFGEIHGNFHRKVHQNKISGNFLGTISKTFSLQGSSGIS